VPAAAGGPGGDPYLFLLPSVPPGAFGPFPPPWDPDLLRPTLAGEGAVRLDDLTGDAGAAPSSPAAQPAAHLPVRSYLALPVVSRTGEVLGGLFFGHREPARFTAHHERLVARIAAPAAIAIDNARLFRAAEEGRQAAQRLAARLAQLQGVGAALAGAKAVDEVAGVIVTAAADAIASDRAALFLVEGGGAGLRLARSVGYRGVWAERWATIGRDAPVPVAEALRTRRLVLVDGPDDWAHRFPTVDESVGRSLALAAIPLALDRQDFGVAVFGWDAHHRLGDDERQFLEALGNQCSQALERARLYDGERETARVLQASLLPPRAPEIPGVDVAALFRAGDGAVAVGGDFYDVFRLGPDRWGVAMGDVCGRGARAAAQTAMVRYTLRSVAAEGAPPAAALARLNRAVLAEEDADDRLCAVSFGHVEPGRGQAWVTVACAGHPCPVVVRRCGRVEQRGRPGTVIGAVNELDVTEDRVGLGPGDALVLFTDGITEARNGAGEEFEDAELPEVLRTFAGRSSAEMADGLRRAALGFAGGSLGDDLAVLVLRVPEEAGDRSGR